MLLVLDYVIFNMGWNVHANMLQWRGWPLLSVGDLIWCLPFSLQTRSGACLYCLLTLKSSKNQCRKATLGPKLTHFERDTVGHIVCTHAVVSDGTKTVRARSRHQVLINTVVY